MKRKKTLTILAIFILGLFFMYGCGENAGSSSDVQTATPISPTTAGIVNLLTSSPQVGSDGSSTVTLTAIVKTASNVALEGKTVAFSSNSGNLTVTSDTTDATGRATATLSAASDKTNRTITVTATADTTTGTTTVNVVGTALSITGQNSMVSGAATVLSIFLKDSAGTLIPSQNVTLTSSLGNSFSSNPAATNVSGQADVTYTAVNSGTDTITASALGATASQTMSISATDFSVTTPAAGTEINIGSVQTVTAYYASGGFPVNGETVNFSTTRGTLSAPSAATGSVLGRDGYADVTLVSTTAGPAIITATIAAVGTVEKAVEFVATTAATVSLQASPGTISTNTAGSTVEQSTIIAVVRDGSGNLVKNKTVRFSLTDVTGGYLMQASDVTNSLGTASTTYISSAAPSFVNGVRVDATVDGSAATASATLTVASKAVYVVFGTGNTIENYSATQYRVPFVALVTDIAGNPVTGVQVTANLTPVTFLKGQYDGSGCPDSEYWLWSPALSGGSYLECVNEDNNVALFGITHPTWLLNGVLDSGGGSTEDVNGDGILTPGNVAEINRTATTDANGFAQFYVIYAKQFANWVKVRIEGIIYSYGNQTLGKTQFYLPVLRSDIACATTPPGAVSPFGLGAGANNVCTNIN